jgi:crotonobetainyl-CoA:carnitine CoA-transferase CaiB-like acyl-CoA transferase
MSGPLAGLRVLDLGTRIAAPFCAGLLAEQGAEVVKIEQPGTGDFMREIGPFVPPDQLHEPSAAEQSTGYSLFWAVEGRGRKSITLDLRTPQGQDVFRQLARESDAVIENFRPGTLEQWHIGPADLDPKLVIVRISSFGQDGPNAKRPGLDRVGIGYGGLLNLTGYPDRPPVRVGVTISDYLTGVFAAQAALGALYARDAHRTGKGAVIDASLYGSVLRILEWTLPAYEKLGIVRSREGNRLANSAPLDNYPTADGKFVCIVAGSDANFSRLCKAMERLDVLDDPRFKKLADRAAHNDEINAIVAEWTSSLPAAEVEARCVATDVPVATAYTAADIFADEHFGARGDIITVDDPVAGPLRQQAPFPRLVGEPVPVPSGAPRLGEHTDEVLTEWLGLSPDNIRELRDGGVV